MDDTFTILRIKKETHKDLKVRAANEGITMYELVERLSKL